ncbi:Sodium leak channel non-selective protein [Fragariocoptes setiger]|uniref:Sodium leak channel non-selective protein n=1 Tax=Fragariocoptes setiger TaxID=1670756 RepID=A0ABQ7SBP2_9ACAR|nr:Sodium leak channel non-selective protein [Fragariocoptes setiger]
MTMLGRKQSIKVGEVTLMDQANGPEETLHENTGVSWFSKTSVRQFMRLLAVLSLLSVCANTTHTFAKHPSLLLMTFAIDVFTALVFTTEMAFKIYSRGLFRGTAPYAKDRWCQFDAAMVFFLWISIALQFCEIFHIVGPYSVLSFLRAPRPLIIIRFIRVFMKFSMPKSRIKQIFKRSSQQICNVTLFFVFFMSLFGMLGVQLFGQIEKHCIVNGTTLEHITINDLAIPDTHCSGSTEYGNQCPPGMVCVELHLTKEVVGYNGYDHIGHSLYTVYQTSSQEGWSHLMYSTFDHYPAWKVAAYFVSLIFFLGWMVRNVFIAVFTETFNEIRVQFQQMWGERQSLASGSVPRVLKGDDRGWKLVEVDESPSSARWMPAKAKEFLNSAAFQIMIFMTILANVIMSASIKFEHDGRPREAFYEHIYWWEVGFTMFFNIEVLFKIACLGTHCYWNRTSHKFEFFLAIACTIHIIPALYMTELADFQVLRVIRLIKASPALEDFAYKSFGPGRKLGSLVIFTVCLLVVTSTISMQLFCSLQNYHRFQDFPYAFMSMFQILTQEAWTDVMNETMLRVRDSMGPYIAVYFIMYHLFVSLIVQSLFVAVILDNLELDEDIKKVKQLKAREQSACVSEELPLRLRLFEHFPDSPQMTRLHKSASEFSVPKVRESFMRNFVDESSFGDHITIKNRIRAGLVGPVGRPVHAVTAAANRFSSAKNSRAAAAAKQQQQQASNFKSTNDPSNLKTLNNAINNKKRQSSLKLLSSPSRTTSANKILRKTTIHQLIQESNNQRMSLLNDEHGSVSQKSLPGGSGALLKHVGTQLRSRADRHSSITAKIQQSSYDHLKENGDMMGENLSRNPYDLTIKMLKRKRQQAELKRSQREKDLRENHPLFDTPLFIVGRESRIRMLLKKIAWAKYQYNNRDPITGKHRKSNYKTFHNLLGLVSYLDWIMIVITTLSCISMMFETPTRRVMSTAALQITEWVFVGAMSVELLLKTLANGLVFTPKALLSTAAGIMDSFIYITSLVFVCWMPNQVEPQSFAQFLMILRCVRPLRIFSLIPHMRQVIYELVRGFKSIFLVCTLLFLLCFVFACYGVHIFGGRLARCNDPTIKRREECVGVFLRRVFVTKMNLGAGNDTYPAILVPRVWANPHRFCFDDIGRAMLALFEVLSFKGWVDIREALIKRFDDSGTALLTVDQRRWCDLKKRLKIAQPLHLPPRPDHIKFRAIIYDITQHRVFKRLIAIFVLLNSCLLVTHWDPEESHTISLATISAGFTVIFTIEVIMRMIAFTPRGYWQSRRNRYDLIVTVISCVWVLVHFILTNNLSNSFGFIVVILRFFTITGKHATLQMLMLTVVVSVYKSFFIILGLFILVFFYSLMGVLLFGTVKFGENLSRQANFKSARLGIITMFRIVTGEDWYRMMHDCMIGPPYCTHGKNYWETDCGNFTMSLIFFSSFYIIITHMVLNLLVAIIMENFSLFYSSEEDALLSYTDIRNFQNTWNMVDAQQRGSIPVRRVRFVLRLLKGRLEVDLNKDRLLFKHMCHEMESLHNGEDVSFHDVLSMLSYRSVDIRKSLQFEELIAREELEYLIEEEVAKKTIRQWLDQCLRRVKQQRQQSSLIQGLRLTNMAGAELFSTPKPLPLGTPGLGPEGDHHTSGSGTGGHETGNAFFGPSGRTQTDIGSTSGAVSTGKESTTHGLSATSMTALAASISKFKKRAESATAARADSLSTASGPVQRKLLTSSTEAARSKDERAHQFKRAIKALTNPSGAKINFANINESNESAIQAQTDDDLNKAKLYKPRLTAAINDIHEWWNYTISLPTNESF